MFTFLYVFFIYQEQFLHFILKYLLIYLLTLLTNQVIRLNFSVCQVDKINDLSNWEKVSQHKLILDIEYIII